MDDQTVERNALVEKQTIYSALLFSSVAAVGNALFVFGHRKSAVTDHPFIFIIGAAIVCLVLFSVTSLFLPKPEIFSFVKDNYPSFQDWLEGKCSWDEAIDDLIRRLD